MHRSEKAQEALKSLEVIQESLSDSSIGMEESMQSAQKAAKIYGDFLKEFSQETFNVKVVSKNAGDVSLRDFDWKSLG